MEQSYISMKIQVEKSSFLIGVAAFVLCVLSFSYSFSQESKRVLFVGNSYTQVNNLPEEFMRVAQSQGKRTECQMQAVGGATFSSHCNNPGAIEAIAQGDWDYIVLQGQSQEVAFPDNQFSWQVYPYAKTLDSLAKAYNPDVKVVFYMTWGYRYGDELNCQFYEPFCTFESMSERLRDNYVLMAEDFGSDVSPVGAAWLESFRQDSTVVLHSSDNSHPNINGTYLAACCFYEIIFAERLHEAYYPSSISPSVATYLQAIADRTVYDNLAHWCYSDIDASLNLAEEREKPWFDCKTEPNSLLIRTNNIEGNVNIELTSSDGRLIERQTYNISNKSTIELHTCYKGVAIIRIGNEKVSLSKKVVLL